MSDHDLSNVVRHFLPGGEGFRWQDVALRDYKSDPSAPFRDITRQTLFGREDMRGELRYFEIAAGGHSTLERHSHTHAVLVLRGMGACLVGTMTFRVAAYDLVTVPPRTWHQFRASANAPLGFLCMVDAERDRPELPDGETMSALQRDPRVAAFLAGESRP
ncbi:MAG: cupin domain-containing protein [Casimicrobiaceae bacterium]